MIKTKAAMKYSITQNITPMIDITIPIDKKWEIQQIRFFITPFIDYFLDVFVDDILMLSLMATAYTGIYTVPDEYKGGTRVRLVLRTDRPYAVWVGCFIQYNEIDTI